MSFFDKIEDVTIVDMFGVAIRTSDNISLQSHALSSSPYSR